MLRLMRVTIVSALVTVFLAAPRPAVAQEVGAMPIPLAEVSAGYTFMRDLAGSDTDFPAGWVFSAALNTSTWLGLVGEVTGSYKNDLNFTFPNDTSTYTTLSQDLSVYTYMAGPRFFKKTGRVVPFAQVLAGVATMRDAVTFTPAISGLGEHSVSRTDFAFQPGGGVTIFLTENVGVRLAGDFRCIIDFDDDENDYDNQIRVVSGFTFNWGAR